MWKYCNLLDVASDTLYSRGICFWRSRLFCSSRIPAAIFLSEIGCGDTMVCLGHICPPSSCWDTHYFLLLLLWGGLVVRILFMGCWWCWSWSDGQGPWCSPCITCLAGTVEYGSDIHLSWLQCSDLFFQYSFCCICRGCCVCSFWYILQERRLQAFSKNEIVFLYCSSTALLRYWHPHE